MTDQFNRFNFNRFNKRLGIIGQILKLKDQLEDFKCEMSLLRDACEALSQERDAAIQRMREVKADARRLKSVLEKVEWRASGAHFVCLWCGGLKRYAGHTPDCARQLALYPDPAIKQPPQESSEEKEGVHE